MKMGRAFKSIGRAVGAGARTLRPLAQEIDELSGGALGDFARQTTQAGEELGELTQGTFADAIAHIAGEALPQLQEALEGLLDDALPELFESADELQEVVLSGLGVAGAMLAFAPPLDWAHGVVGAINDLLDALNLGL